MGTHFTRARITGGGLILLLPLLLSSQEVETMTVTGMVRSASFAPLPYANVVVVETTLGTTTDINGRFQLAVPPADSLRLLISYMGYEAQQVSVSMAVASRTSMVITLRPTALSFSPVVIVGESALEQARLIEPSLRIFRGEQMTSIPSIGGPDVFRALQALPGVTSSSELSNQLYIRGGTPDQNLVLMNGVPIYQPFHLFGLTSSVDAAAVDYVKYYSGGFSVRYGDRLSGVLDIVTKPGTDSLTARVDSNFINSGATIAGSLGEKWRWRLTGRRSYFDYLAKQIEQHFPYHYYDFEGKISFLPNPRNLVTLNTFFSQDDYSRINEQIHFNPDYRYHTNPLIARADSNKFYEKDNSVLRWRNRMASLRWIGRYSSQAYTEATVYFSELFQDLENQVGFFPHDSASASTRKNVAYFNEPDSSKPGALAQTILRDVGVNLVHQWYLLPSVEAVIGASMASRRLDYCWNSPDFEVISPYVNVFMDFPPDTMDYQLESESVGCFAEVTYQPSPLLWFRFGCRLDRHSIYNTWLLQPRLNVSWKFAPFWWGKLGWGRFSQSLSSSVDYGFYSVVSLYLPTEGPVPGAGHALLGLIYDNQKTLRCELAGYYKDFDHLLYVHKDGTIRTGEGYSYGLEVLASAALQAGRSMQLAYAYAIVRKTRGSESYYPNYDQRHKLNWMLDMPLKRGRALNLNWRLSTGRPANLATSIYFAGQRAAYYWDEEPYPYPGPWPFYLDMPLNVFRYPVFHRLDLAIRRERKLWRGTLTTYLLIMNVYARKNVVYYEDVKYSETDELVDPDDPTGTIKDPYEVTSFRGFPFLPTLGVSYEF
ncbi:MAG: carboxypeptidase-like regulatory domain-containing protein [Fidelibacterota bacterium]|nr:MAG: carboxypeptidase-like regulatory domain-containing protein [Candidatus Neomarinimicrobiota bacterium]